MYFPRKLLVPRKDKMLPPALVSVVVLVAALTAPSQNTVPAPVPLIVPLPLTSSVWLLISWLPLVVCSVPPLIVTVLPFAPRLPPLVVLILTVAPLLIVRAPVNVFVPPRASTPVAPEVAFTVNPVPALPERAPDSVYVAFEPIVIA